MSKEYLEAFEVIRNKFIDLFHEDIPDFDTVENALNRLEAIDNAKPSEALKHFETLEIHNKYDNCWQIFSKDIEQALIKAEQEHKAWDIVVKKNVDMLLIKKYDNVSDYNSAVWLSGREKLTEEEFKLLKECLE